MSKNNYSHTSRKTSYPALGLAIGLVFGGFIGIILGNMIIFAGFGMVLGLAIGYALDNRRLGGGA